jgi:carbon-monoxide dehydrogenase iron sulfur subunit
MKRIFCNSEKCLACKTCELACALGHSVSKDILTAIYETPLPKYRIKVQNTSSLLYCRHCGKPRCVDACESGALSKDEITGIVVLDEEKCTGCWECITACPFGAVSMDLERGIAVMCDLCQNSDMPACVEACPTGALFYGEAEEFYVQNHRYSSHSRCS